MKRKLSKLELRFLFGFVLLSVLVCGSNSVIGYYQYRDSIQDQYNEQVTMPLRWRCPMWTWTTFGAT